MQRLAPHEYRSVHPRCFALWAGHLGFCSAATRHWLKLDRVTARDGSVIFSTAKSLIQIDFWWESGLGPNLIFGGRFEVSRGVLPPEGEAIWIGHRLCQLIQLTTEPRLILNSSEAIRGFWVRMVSDLIKSKSLESVE